MNDDTQGWQDVLASVWDTLEGPATSAPWPEPAAQGAAYTPTQLLIMRAKARSSKGLLEGFGEEGFLGGWVPYGQAIQQLYRRLAGGDLAKEKRIELAMQRIQDGTASADDHALIIDYSVEASRPGSVLYTAAQTLRSTVKFGGELAITSPLGGAASRLATAGRAAVPGAGAATRALGFAARTGAQFGATEAIGYGLEALATVGTSDEAWSPADYEAARRALPEFELEATDEGRLRVALQEVAKAHQDARVQGLISNYIEVASEAMGPQLGRVFKALPAGRQVMALELYMFKWLRGRKYSKSLDDMLARFGRRAEINSVTEEMLEELAGSTARAFAPGLEETPDDIVPTFEEFVGMMLGMSVMPGARAVAGRVFRGQELTPDSMARALAASSRLEEGLGTDGGLKDALLGRSPAADPGAAARMPVAEDAPEAAQAAVEAGLPEVRPGSAQRPTATAEETDAAFESWRQRSSARGDEPWDYVPDEELEGEAPALLQRMRQRYNVDIRVAGEGFPGMGAAVGTGAVVLSREAAEDPNLAVAYTLHEVLHDRGIKDWGALSELYGQVRTHDQGGLEAATARYKTLRPDVADELLAEEGLAQYTQELGGLIDYLVSSDGQRYVRRVLAQPRAQEAGRLRRFLDWALSNLGNLNARSRRDARQAMQVLQQYASGLTVDSARAALAIRDALLAIQEGVEAQAVAPAEGEAAPEAAPLEQAPAPEAAVEAAVEAAPEAAEVAPAPEAAPQAPQAAPAPAVAPAEPAPPAAPPAPQEAAQAATEPRAAEAPDARARRYQSGATGDQAVLDTADDREVTVTYRLVDADDLLPSHDARRGFAPNEGGDINERAYNDPTEGAASRARVERIASDPRPRKVYTDASDPTVGLPITDPSGRVLGGNGRTMGIQLAYSRGGLPAMQWREAAREFARRAGFSEEAIFAVQNPVVVREVSAEDAGARGAQSRVYNEGAATARTPTIDAQSRASKLGPEHADALARVVADRTLAQAFQSDARTRELLRTMAQAGAWSEADNVAYLDGRGLLTPAGRDVVQRTLLATIVTEVRNMADMKPAMVQKLLRAMPHMMRVAAFEPRWRSTITNALDGVADLASYPGTLQDLLGQATIAPRPWRDDATSHPWIEPLLTDTQKAWTARMALMEQLLVEQAEAAAGQEMMFGQGEALPWEDIQRRALDIDGEHDRLAPGSYDELTQDERAMVDAAIANSYAPERTRQLLNELRGSRWATMAIKQAKTRAALEQLLRGEQPEYDNPLGAPSMRKTVAGIMGGGAEYIWTRLASEKTALLGHAAKPGNTVPATFLNCQPTEECADSCYALRGRNYVATVVKAELVEWAVRTDPVRAAGITAMQYKATPDYHASKALRLFDRGDSAPYWIPYIKELNRQGIRVQVFSKHPEFVRAVPAENIRKLSVDSGNLDVAEANPDLDLAFVYVGTDAEVDWMVKHRDRIRVILPIKLGKKLLDDQAVAKLTKAGLRRSVCPVDAGWVDIGPAKGTAAELRAIGEDVRKNWQCTRCDAGGGVGCYQGSTTAKMRQFSKSLQQVATGARADKLIEEVRLALQEAPADVRQQLLAQLDEVVSAARSGYDEEAADGVDQGASLVSRTIRLARQEGAEDGGAGTQPDAKGRGADDRLAPRRSAVTAADVVRARNSRMAPRPRPRHDELGLFSTVEAAILASPRNSYPVSNIEGVLEKAGAVREEMRWLGLPEWVREWRLANNKATKVPAEDLLAFVRAHDVRLVATPRGPGLRGYEEKKRALQDGIRGLAPLQLQQLAFTVYVHINRFGSAQDLEGYNAPELAAWVRQRAPLVDWYRQSKDNPEILAPAMVELVDAVPDPGTKSSQRIYTELYAQMAAIEGLQDLALDAGNNAAQFAEWRDDSPERDPDAVGPDGAPVDEGLVTTAATPRPLPHSYQELVYEVPKWWDRKPVRQHFTAKGTDTDVLMHARVQARQYPAPIGLVLDVQELQSDWHQQARGQSTYSREDQAAYDRAKGRHAWHSAVVENERSGQLVKYLAAVFEPVRIELVEGGSEDMEFLDSGLIIRANSRISGHAYTYSRWQEGQPLPQPAIDVQDLVADAAAEMYWRLSERHDGPNLAQAQTVVGELVRIIGQTWPAQSTIHHAASMGRAQYSSAPRVTRAADESDGIAKILMHSLDEYKACVQVLERAKQELREWLAAAPRWLEIPTNSAGAGEFSPPMASPGELVALYLAEKIEPALEWARMVVRTDGEVDPPGVMPRRSQLLEQGLSGIPEAPYAGTKQWASFLVKAVLRKAIAEGYDGLVVTTGQRQAVRWGSDGLRDFYDKTVMGRLVKTARRMDPKHPGSRLIIDDGSRAPRAEEVVQAFHYLPITPALRDAVAEQGLPRWAPRSAWHGSPWLDILKFSTEYMGSGEGRQAFGWGLYFADLRKVAEYYRDPANLPEPFTIDGQPAQQYLDGLRQETQREAGALMREAMRVYAAAGGESATPDDPAIARARDLVAQAIDAWHTGEAKRVLASKAINRLTPTGTAAQIREALLDLVRGLKATTSLGGGDAASWAVEPISAAELAAMYPDAWARVTGHGEPRSASEAQLAQNGTDAQRADYVRIFYMRDARALFSAATSQPDSAYPDRRVDSLRQDPSGWPYTVRDWAGQEAVDLVGELPIQGADEGRQRTGLYRVTLMPEDDEYLLYDVPLDQQSALVQKALAPLLAERGLPPDYRGIGRDLYDHVGLLGDNRSLSRTERDKAASLMLLGLGVRGIKYLDGTSRADGVGSYNYVIFDGADVRIDERLAPRPAMDQANLDAFMRGSHLREGYRADGTMMPIPLYHMTRVGTRIEALPPRYEQTGPVDYPYFTAFRAGGYDESVSGPGIWLASHPDRTFARHNTGPVREDLVVPGQMVYQVYANLQRPLYITNFFGGDGRETAEDIQAQMYREDYGSEFPSRLSHEAKRELEEQGYDGIIMTRRDVPDSAPLSERIFEVVAFRPEQLVSATGNVGTYRQQAPGPDQLRTVAQGQPMSLAAATDAARQGDLRFAPRGTYVLPGTEGLPSETDPQGWLERAVERYLDRYTSVRRLVAKYDETGGELDFDRALRLLPGRKREAGRELNRKYRQRFEAVMIRHSIEPRDAGNYLKALHVPERNAQMRKIGAPGRPDMTDAEARAIASEYESSEKGKAYRQLAAIMRRMHKETLDIMVESGLISKEVRAQIDAVYKNYLPLPVRQGEDDSGVLDEVFVGRGISMRGKEVQRALGNVRPDDPEALIAYAFVQAAGARMRAEQNMTARMAYAFLQRHQSTTPEGTKSPWVFIDPGDYPTRPAVSKHGLRIDVPDTAFQSAQNAFAVKIDGEERYVLFDENRPYVARALNESNVLPSHPAIASIGMYTSLWSRLATGWNPEFTLRNFPRDVGTMIFRLTSEFDKSAAARAVQALPRAGRVIWREMVQGREPDTADATGKLWLEYRRAGGPIEFKNLANVEEVMREMQTEFLRGTGGEARGPRVLRAGRTAFDKIQAVNTVFENMVRFAAYIALRERGATADNAALYAKEMTTNFEQRGTHIGIWNSLYAFANAGLVGFARDVQTLKSRTAQRMVLAGVVGGVLAYALNRALAPEDEDEDNYFATLSKHYHKTNFHVQWPGEQAGVSVPLPFTLRVFNYMGNRLGAIAYGDTDASTAAADVLEAAFAETNPWGGESSALNTIMPSLGDPLVDVARNRTFTGGPIRPTQYDTTQPLSQLAWDDTNPYARMLAQSLNSLTGGDRFKPGAIDLSPDDMMHVIRSYSAGVGNLLQRSLELGKRAQDGLPIEPRDVPFYRIFRQGSNPGKTRRAFNQIRQELKRTENRLRAAKREGDTAEQARLEALPIYQARQDIKDTQSRVRDLADEAALRSSQGDPQAALELELQALELYHAALRAANAAGYRIREP